MDRTERFYRIEQLLRDRGVVPIREFLDTLEISRATFKRDIEYLRDRLNAPIEWDRERGGYRFGHGKGGGARFELPGLWLNASEFYALLTVEQLLKGLEPGLLARHATPLIERLHQMLASDDVPIKEIQKRIRLIRIASRATKPEYFTVAATAVLRRRQLRIEHWNRMRDEVTERTISPQRLVYYRGNWYVDAWCHLRKDIRSFALDVVREAELLDERARDVPEKDLDDALSSGYGIFTGRSTEWATLKFTPEAARWVAHEKWHAKQKSRFDADGSFVLEIPFGDDRELVMDVLRHGANVEVVAPAGLRNKVAAAHRAAAERYRKA